MKLLLKKIGGKKVLKLVKNEKLVFLVLDLLVDVNFEDLGL